MSGFSGSRGQFFFVMSMSSKEKPIRCSIGFSPEKVNRSNKFLFLNTQEFNLGSLVKVVPDWCSAGWEPIRFQPIFQPENQSINPWFHQPTAQRRSLIGSRRFLFEAQLPFGPSFTDFFYDFFFTGTPSSYKIIIQEIRIFFNAGHERVLLIRRARFFFISGFFFFGCWSPFPFREASGSKEPTAMIANGILFFIADRWWETRRASTRSRRSELLKRWCHHRARSGWMADTEKVLNNSPSMKHNHNRPVALRMTAINLE